MEFESLCLRQAILLVFQNNYFKKEKKNIKFNKKCQKSSADLQGGYAIYSADPNTVTTL